MKQLLVLACMFAGSLFLKLNAQEIDGIYFNLYVDSLRKGDYNYINVDGKLKDGRFIPLDSSQVVLRSTAGKWVGNSLVIDSFQTADSVVIHASLKENPAVSKTVTVYIKKVQELHQLPTTEELLERWRKEEKQPRRSKKG